MRLAADQPAAMAFFQRVMSYLLNEVLVNGLANRCAQPGRSTARDRRQQSFGHEIGKAV